MRILFYLLLGIHALIHIMGFVKAFEWSDFAGITQPISKPVGLAWLAASILLLVTLITHYTEWSHWWKLALIALMISQIIIILYWQDAKWGTLPNIILLLVALTDMGQQWFDTFVAREREDLLTQVKTTPNLQPIEDLPIPVQRWLRFAGIAESTTITQIFLSQKAQMKMKPEQKDWHEATANQLFTAYPPRADA